jgi:hypothetical protein
VVTCPSGVMDHVVRLDSTGVFTCWGNYDGTFRTIA